MLRLKYYVKVVQADTNEEDLEKYVLEYIPKDLEKINLSNIKINIFRIDGYKANEYYCECSFEFDVNCKDESDFYDNHEEKIEKYLTTECFCLSKNIDYEFS